MPKIKKQTKKTITIPYVKFSRKKIKTCMCAYCLNRKAWMDLGK
jgi:hypothetical protein